MLNILVPTDLSDLSKVAIEYAIKMANKLDGNITLLHVVTVIQPTRATMRIKFKSLEQELVDTAKEDLDHLLAEVSKGRKLSQPIKIKIVKGTSFNATVKREAKKLRIGLIVMGTRGASGLKKYVLGSSTTSVIEVSSVPVLAVPELGAFKNFKNVVYATDLKHVEKEIKTLLPYLEISGSTIHLIHVTNAQKNVLSIEAKIDASVMKSGYGNVIVRVLVNKNVDHAIESYVEAINADLLTMFTHEPSFYEKMFDRSMTRKMAFQSKIPLLAFKQR
ncbi:MAG TPA: universal stress protein [Chryseolinea sp.]|nr:universal stress protein [Chryseolinea sp.]HPH45809.1 universal stress protein [Chryseolinea sp.]HPM29424.1 universal stress protein [Chryseolinea sp.]